ncbi:MAG: rRNA maturation RNase YbeY [Crocinitomicaceae bacterium]|nr:rRNA maturation RNase YbeY [Crocinitomicaceae bacterium]
MISCFFEDIEDFDISLELYRRKISYIIDNEGFKEENVVLVMCSDNFLLELNKKHLNHDYFTDIITFSYTTNNHISGDLFISVDRVKDNARNQNLSFENELERVIYHGVLHLCGYNDKTPEEIKEMRSKENYYLK